MTEPMNQRTAVQNLQRYLRRLSYEENNILAVPVDGIFDSRTEEALSEFQQMNDLPVTGRADRITWDLLFDDYQRLSQEDLRVSPDFFPSTPLRYETTSGESGLFIHIVQLMLNEFTVLYDDFPLLTVTGKFDSETEEAVKRFQTINGLEETGLVNRRTWNHMSEEYNRYLSEQSQQ